MGLFFCLKPSLVVREGGVSYSISNMQNSIKIWSSEMENYKLLDSGNKQKLEEINGVKIVRAEPRAWWDKKEAKSWELGADRIKNFEEIIEIGIGGIKAKIKYKNTSKHIGIFPEQFPQWKWVGEQVKSYETRNTNKKLKILNLFGYTGITSLVAGSAGASVTHVDASKPSVDWARENQKLSGLEDAPIRWIVDDVIKFLKKEIKRGERYDAIIMDPPSYGKGPKGEVWKIEEELPKLLSVCREILSDKPLFVIFNMYSTELSSISVANLLSEMTESKNGEIEIGELAIKEESGGRLLPLSIFALWQAN